MCGRYVVVSSVEVIEKRFNVTVPELPLNVLPNYNLGPGMIAPVITNENPSQLSFFQFGLTPVWAKKKMYLFNARAEGDGNPTDDPNYTGGKGIISKPSFKRAIRSQRCLVIADAFYEGPKTEGLSKPYLAYLRNHQRPFAFAGIWEKWKNPETEAITYSFAIITTVANELMQKIGHHRSPVILHRHDESRWLKSEHLTDITQLLEPFPADEMNAYPVNPAVKNPRVNEKSLLDPVGERVLTETETIVKTDIKLQGMGEGKRKKF